MRLVEQGEARHPDECRSNRSLGPQAEALKACPILGGMRGPCLPPSSDRLHRIQVAQPQGDPSGITTAERYRVAWVIY